MGAAISCFAGAQAIQIPRSRFAPVKKTDDLLALRSDAYRLTEDFRIELIPERNGVPPLVKLDDMYKFVDRMETLIPRGPPSLKDCVSLKIEGPMEFDPGAVIQGKVVFRNRFCPFTSGTKVIAPRVYRNEIVPSYMPLALLKQVQGLNVAFLSGSYDSVAFKHQWGRGLFTGSHYTQAAIERLEKEARQLFMRGQRVDILLTSEWPDRLWSPEKRKWQMTMVDSECSSPAVSRLVARLRPQYHIFGKGDRPDIPVETHCPSFWRVGSKLGASAWMSQEEVMARSRKKQINRHWHFHPMAVRRNRPVEELTCYAVFEGHHTALGLATVRLPSEDEEELKRWWQALQVRAFGQYDLSAIIDVDEVELVPSSKRAKVEPSSKMELDGVAEEVDIGKRQHVK
eukprot:g20896.t2